MISYWVLFGILGVLLICSGILMRNRGRQDEFYFFGGVSLLIYSISIQDYVFIVLQIIFILVAAYDFLKRKK